MLKTMAAEPMSLLGLEKTSLRQQALAALRRAITSGELPPGTHLVETDLSEMLQISRGTLREALRQLQQEGLVSAGARGRLSVRHLDAKEIRDIFAVRAALESLAARQLCAMQDRSEVIAALREAVGQMERAAEAGLEERIEADLDFHRAMCRLTGNDTLLHSWRSLEGNIRMSIMFAGLDRAVKNMSVQRHSEIVDAIATGDTARVSEVIAEHMEGAAAVLVA
jgi:DNA-binding GntR family transcriptional regulator